MDRKVIVQVGKVVAEMRVRKVSITVKCTFGRMTMDVVEQRDEGLGMVASRKSGALGQFAGRILKIRVDSYGNDQHSNIGSKFDSIFRFKVVNTRF